MSKKSTKERILAAAEQVILSQGFSATNIEDILSKAAITKSGFFYHYANKQDLARALVMRYLENDAAFLMPCSNRLTNSLKTLYKGSCYS